MNMEIKIRIDKKDLGDWGYWLGSASGFGHQEVCTEQLLRSMCAEVTRQEKLLKKLAEIMPGLNPNMED